MILLILKQQPLFHLLKISLTELDFFSPSFYSSIQFSHSVVSDSLKPPWTAAHQASVSITNSRSLFKLMSMKSVMSSNHLILCHPFLLLPSIFPSIGIFSNKSALHIRWPKYWSFSFSISHSKEYSGLISLRIDQFDLVAVLQTLKSLLQHHNSNASVLWCTAFLMVQHLYPYMNITTQKTIALTICTSVGKTLSLLFNMLSKFVIAFLPRNKCLFMAVVTICSDFGVQENKVCHYFQFSHIYLP